LLPPLARKINTLVKVVGGTSSSSCIFLAYGNGEGVAFHVVLVWAVLYGDS